MQLAGATCLYYNSLIFRTSKKLTLHFVFVAFSLVAAMAYHIILIKCNMLHLLSVMNVLDIITENRLLMKSISPKNDSGKPGGHHGKFKKW